MELKDLKNTWDKLASDEQLDENQLKMMLRKRTKNVLERIDRNIKIGFGILFVLIVFFVLDDFIISPQLLEKVGGNISVPNWLLFLGVFSNSLIFTTFIYFVIKYYHVKKSCDISCNLRETLVKIINTLNIYQRLFYLALVSVTITIAVGFVTGIYEGVLIQAEQQGIPANEIGIGNLATTILITTFLLFFMTFSVFVILRWGFRKLYGNYIRKLKRTLKELDEIGD
jgi:hypothetical protein